MKHATCRPSTEIPLDRNTFQIIGLSVLVCVWTMHRCMRDQRWHHLFRTVSLVLAAVILSGPVRAQQSTDRAERLFRLWDKDGNGNLEKSELPRSLRGNFERVDRDGDGVISLSEHLAQMRGATAAQGSGFRVPKGVRHLKDLPYANTSNQRQTLHLLVPDKNSEGPLPVVVFIHGGGWRKGNKDSGLRRVTRFVQSGRYAAASVGYRLTDEAQWPAQIHDCKAAIRWLRANSEKYHLNPNRILVMGTSAGGHLAAMLGVTADVASMEGTLGAHTHTSSRVTAVVDFFGPTDILTMNSVSGAIDHFAPDSPESLLLGGPVLERRTAAREASPLTHVSKDDAPHLILHGTRDPLVPFDQSVRYQKKLRAAGVYSVLIRVIDGGHGFSHPEIDRRVDQFLSRFLLDQPVEIDDTPLTLPVTRP